MLEYNFKLLDDSEGNQLPKGVDKLIDTHVHVFPDNILEAIWWWFDNYAWPIRYKLKSDELIEFLLERGVDHIIALQYAHKPDVAGYLNNFMKKIVDKYEGKVTGLASVLPGEKGSEEILKDAFESGLSGVKLHSHVQCFEMLSEGMDIVYDTCQRYNKPLVIHAGREPKSPEYACDPHELCDVKLVKSVLDNYPDLKLCVPHLGVDEYSEYKELIEKYDNLWLDTAMVITDYLPVENPHKLANMRLDRIMYGTDFPNIPYAWDRELKEILEMNMDKDDLNKILWENAEEFYELKQG